MIGGACVPGNRFQLYSAVQEMLAVIARDVDTAKADEVIEAVIRTAAPGVRCRLLIYTLGRTGLRLYREIVVSDGAAAA